MIKYYLSIRYNKCVFANSISPIYTFSLARNIIVYTPSQGTKREKYSYNIQQQRLKRQLRREKNTFSTISLLIGRVFSITWRNMDGPNPSETDIKVFIRAPTILLLNTAPFLNWKVEK